MFSKNGQSFTPEQKRALGVLDKHMKDFTKETQCEEQISVELLTTEGSAFFTHYPCLTKNLPRESNWVWNQSRGKKKVDSADGKLELCFYKMGTVCKIPNVNLPSICKLWIFKIRGPHEFTLNFIWCEKGAPPVQQVEDEVVVTNFLKHTALPDLIGAQPWGTLLGDFSLKPKPRPYLEPPTTERLLRRIPQRTKNHYNITFDV